LRRRARRGRGAGGRKREGGRKRDWGLGIGV